jgi:HMG-box domain
MVKPVQNSFSYFLQAEHKKKPPSSAAKILKKDKKTMKNLSKIWKRLPGEEKEMYHQKTREDRVRYRMELAALHSHPDAQADIVAGDDAEGHSPGEGPDPDVDGPLHALVAGDDVEMRSAAGEGQDPDVDGPLPALVAGDDAEGHSPGEGPDPDVDGPLPALVAGDDVEMRPPGECLGGSGPTPPSEGWFSYVYSFF